ncbi:MAG: hypothetical protein PHE55_00545 [Methylococcaceae bacterium]|nr:hypothetical protein [Methylococcaceae bacterium]
MALSTKALQKKRAKKTAKRKEIRKSGSSLTSAMAVEWLSAAHAPIADVYTPKGIFEIGLGSVWFSRRLEDGRYAMSAFLVDTFCLGVKNAMYAIMEADQYRVQMESFLSSSGEEFVHRKPAYARKLVEMAEAYARELGLEPHNDYKAAKLIFGDVDASACDEHFVFGRDGNPCYVSGPGDSPAIQRRVMKQLEKISQDPYALLALGPSD